MRAESAATAPIGNMEPEELNRQLEQLHSSAEAASSEGLADEAIRKCEAAMELLDQNFDEDTAFTHSDFLMIAGHSCWEDSDIEAALRYYRQANDMDPGRVDAQVAMGVALFHLCRFETAAHILELVSVEDPDVGEVWHYLALLERRRNNTELADLFFRRANEMEPERWLIPKFLEHAEVERLVEEMLAQFPKSILKILEGVSIVVEERPPDVLLHSSEPPLDPLLLGLFDGTPYPEQSTFGAPEKPNVILIFSENIALVAADEEKLREELAITLKHEVGHFLGLDEDELASRGLD